MSRGGTFARSLQCRECAETYPLEAKYLCEKCFGSLEVDYDYDAMRRAVVREDISARARTIWRYRELLPCADPDPVSLSEGFTPLLRARNLARRYGLDELYLKNDCTNPTHSFKDRVVSVAVTKAREFGFTTVACVSTGNLANSVAAYAAHAGLRAAVFLPAGVERSKLIHSWVYGPDLIPVTGTYDDVNRLCSEIATRYPWAFVNVNMRPYYAEGSKTIGYEIAEQMGFEAPDHIVVPAASGSLMVKIWKGLKEFEKLAFIEPVKTKVHLAQAEGCSPIAQAYRIGTLEIRPVKPKTVVRSLSIGNPSDGYFALKALAESGGVAETATDEEAKDAIALLGQTEGVFAEAAAGVVVACFVKMVKNGIIKSSDRTVLVITGSGFKTSDVLEDKAEIAEPVPATLAEFEALYSLAGPRRNRAG